jgi:hypothetical protein
MNTRDLKEGEVIIITTRDDEQAEAIVAKDTPYKEDFPFVLVRVDDRTFLVNRNEIEEQ